MTELEKIEYAKSFIDKLANGINPIDDSPIPDSDTVNNVRLSRCFFFVSDVLRQVIENGGVTQAPPQPTVVKAKKGRKQPYYLLPEHIADFEFSDTPISATEIYNRIVSAGPKEGVRRLPKRKLTKWLLYCGFLELQIIDNNKVLVPTDSGREIGIFLEERKGEYGNYIATLYPREAQEFIIDNIEAMLALDNGTYREKLNLENQGKHWETDDDASLVELYKSGRSICDIALALKRSEKAIRLRLHRWGYHFEDMD